MAVESRLAIKDLRPEAAEWPDLQITDGQFHRIPYKEFISSRAKLFFIKASPSGHFVKAASLNGRFIKDGQAQWPFYEANGRFIKANGHFIKANAILASQGGP